MDEKINEAFGRTPDSLMGLWFWGLVLAFFTWAFLRSVYKSVTSAKKRVDFRGREKLSADEVQKASREIIQSNDQGVRWGGVLIPSEEATKHFCVVGAVGSGKTLTLRMLMRSQLTRISSASDIRAMVYDSKQDMVPILESMNLRCPIVILNPFDKRAAAWHMASDIDSKASATQLAHTLITDEDEKDKFFCNAAREILAGVITTFILTRPGAWTLREVLLVMNSRERQRQVLNLRPETRDLVEKFIECGDVTYRSIMATVATKLGPFESVAGAWEHAQRKISLVAWTKTESVLVLGNDERVRAVLDRLNQLIVAIANQQVMMLPEPSDRRIWFFFDEFREAGKLDGLHSLIVRGRSKGACVVLGFQDIQGLQDVYGEKVANEIVGQCANKALLRMESPETAEWASQIVSSIECMEIQHSTTSSAQGVSNTASYQKVTRPQAMSAEFLSLPPASPRNGLPGFYVVRSIGFFKETHPWQEVLRDIGPLDKSICAFDAAPKEWQFMSPWSDIDEDNVISRFAENDDRTPSQSDETPRPTPPRPASLKALGRITRDV